MNGGVPPQTRIRWEDIEVVKELIERCLCRNLNKDLVVETLRVVARIEPKFTIMVWDKLENENRRFFEAYYKKLVDLDTPGQSAPVQINGGNKSESEHNEAIPESSVGDKTRPSYNSAVRMSMDTDTQQPENAKTRSSEDVRRLLGFRPRDPNAVSRFLHSQGFGFQPAGN